MHNSSTPLVSIVLPTYNGEAYLEQSIESCLTQSYKNWELIIVDDCSTDKTPEIINNFSEKEPRIKVIRHQSNKKLPAALNSGFSDAKGKYFTWTSDDNYYAPDALSTLVSYLENNKEKDLVYTDFTMVDEQGEKIGERVTERPELLLERNVVGASFLYHRKIHEKLSGFNENKFMIEDYDFWLRALKHFSFSRLHENLYFYRWHNKSLSLQKKKEIAQLHIETIQEHIKDLNNIPKKFIALGFLSLANFHKKQSPKKSLYFFLKAAMVSPTVFTKKQNLKSAGQLLCAFLKRKIKR